MLLIGRELDCTAPPPDPMGQIVAPNDVTGTRWQRLNPSHFGFMCVQWEKVETRHPSLFISIISTHMCYFKLTISTNYHFFLPFQYLFITCSLTFQPFIHCIKQVSFSISFHKLFQLLLNFYRIYKFFKNHLCFPTTFGTIWSKIFLVDRNSKHQGILCVCVCSLQMSSKQLLPHWFMQFIHKYQRTLPHLRHMQSQLNINFKMES